MKSIIQIKYIFSAIAFFVTGCNRLSNREIENFSKTPITIPYKDLDKINNSKDTNSLSSTIVLRIVNYIDALGCSVCTISRMADVEKDKRNQDELKNVEFVYIVETKIKKKNDVYRMFHNVCIEGNVYIDTCCSFRRANPHIPDDPLFHTFVLNEQDSVVLVGDPFKNEKMEKLLLKVIEKEKHRRKKDKTIRA